MTVDKNSPNKLPSCLYLCSKYMICEKIICEKIVKLAIKITETIGSKPRLRNKKGRLNKSSTNCEEIFYRL